MRIYATLCNAGDYPEDGQYIGIVTTDLKLAWELCRKGEDVHEFEDGRYDEIKDWWECTIYDDGSTWATAYSQFEFVEPPVERVTRRNDAVHVTVRAAAREMAFARAKEMVKYGK